MKYANGSISVSYKTWDASHVACKLGRHDECWLVHRKHGCICACPCHDHIREVYVIYRKACTEQRARPEHPARGFRFWGEHLVELAQAASP